MKARTVRHRRPSRSRTMIEKYLEESESALPPFFQTRDKTIVCFEPLDAKAEQWLASLFDGTEYEEGWRRRLRERWLPDGGLMVRSMLVRWIEEQFILAGGSFDEEGV